MSVVHKAVITPPGIGDQVVQVVLPYDAEPLHVAFQGDQLCLWYATADAKDNIIEHTSHRFLVGGTGFHFDPGHGDADRMRMHYVGTAHHPSGLVFHVFDLDGDT